MATANDKRREQRIDRLCQLMWAVLPSTGIGVDAGWVRTFGRGAVAVAAELLDLIERNVANADRRAAYAQLEQEKGDG